VCTLALYFRVLDDYPLIVAANRDEHYDRPSQTPTLLTTDPAIVAGKDLLAGGTWLGMNECGVLVGILNRRLNGERDPSSKSRSRGLLCLDLLRLKTAVEALGFMQALEEHYQPFTVVFADLSQVWLAYNLQREIKTLRLNEGLHVLSNTGDVDTRSEKINRAYRQFAQLIDDLRLNDPSAWPQLFAKVLKDHSLGNGSEDPRDAICVHTEISGTVSSSLVVYSRSERRFQTFHCAGAPCQHSFGECPPLSVVS
jgi:uncharacterized protein with NRDE domain